ncbi:hypothetical protein C1H46_015634 [Malus baccata]|uniref:Peptidase S8/S53 domain-containing protein n=1 Tax=Malus baccata TaxID=106549 RepID=A0A540MIW9_MALBA|nr:hypothetical protein C1H46_015634 [Malus baccata]
MGPRFPASSCNGKIVSAKFFSAGAEAAATLNSTVDFLSPFDAVGHGSHVASTTAGNAGVPVVVNGYYYGEASGMAPRARIAVYKAVYPTVGTFNRCGFVVQAAGNQGPGSSSIVSYSPWAVAFASPGTDRNYPSSILCGNGTEIEGVGLSGPTFGYGLLLHKLVLARDAVKADGTFPRTQPYVEECQYPEALDHNVVQGSIVICTFSAGFYNGTSSLTAIINTAKGLGFMGFILVANPAYGDFIAEPIPFVAAKAAIGEGRVASFMGQAPVVSRFSSRGPDFTNTSRNPFDVLKPDILAPGHQIWAAWSPVSASEPALTGYNFAPQSGTSMATPHVAGIGALIKQYNPSWIPSMIASAISTTSTKYDKNGELIMAEGSGIGSTYPSSHFDLGAGFVGPSRAMDPGLVLPSGYEDYISFLCSLPEIKSPATTRNATGQLRNYTLDHPANLNLPSITISALRGSQIIRRIFNNVGSKPETYVCSAVSPNGTIVDLCPTWFRIAPQGIQELHVQAKVTQAMDDFTFGEIVLTGSLNHIVLMSLSVFPVSISKS